MSGVSAGAPGASSAHLLAPDLLVGQVIFISGGGSGVNLGIARVLADLGADLAIFGRTEGRLEHAAEDLRARGGRVVVTVGDVRDLDQVETAFVRTRDDLGPVSGVVCGAAGNFVAPAEDITSNGFRAVVDIDLVGTFHCSRAAFDQLQETRGSLLFVTGGQSSAPYVGQAHVGAAKAGVDQLMRGLAVEWAGDSIRVNSIMPGPVQDTEGMRRLTASGHQPWVDSVPMRRFAVSEEIGRMAAVLLSPIASYVTGAVIHVDGGMSLTGPGLVNTAAGTPPSS